MFTLFTFIASIFAVIDNHFFLRRAILRLPTPALPHWPPLRQALSADERRPRRSRLVVHGGHPHRVCLQMYVLSFRVVDCGQVLITAVFVIPPFDSSPSRTRSKRTCRPCDSDCCRRRFVILFDANYLASNLILPA